MLNPALRILIVLNYRNLGVLPESSNGVIKSHLFSQTLAKCSTWGTEPNAQNPGPWCVAITDTPHDLGGISHGLRTRIEGLTSEYSI